MVIYIISAQGGLGLLDILNSGSAQVQRTGDTARDWVLHTVFWWLLFGYRLRSGLKTENLTTGSLSYYCQVCNEKQFAFKLEFPYQ